MERSIVVSGLRGCFEGHSFPIMSDLTCLGHAASVLCKYTGRPFCRESGRNHPPMIDFPMTTTIVGNHDDGEKKSESSGRACCSRGRDALVQCELLPSTDFLNRESIVFRTRIFLFGAPSFLRASLIVQVDVSAALNVVLRDEGKSLAASMKVETAEWNLHKHSKALCAPAPPFMSTGKCLINSFQMPVGFADLSRAHESFRWLRKSLVGDWLSTWR